MAQEGVSATPWRSTHLPGRSATASERLTSTEKQDTKSSRFFSPAAAQSAPHNPAHSSALASDAQHNKARAASGPAHAQQSSDSLSGNPANGMESRRPAFTQAASTPPDELGLDLIDELLDLPAEVQEHKTSAPAQTGPAAAQQPAKGGFAAAKKLGAGSSLRGGFAGAKRQGAVNLLQQALLKKGTEGGKPRPGNLARQQGFNPPRQLAAPKAQPFTAAADRPILTAAASAQHPSAHDAQLPARESMHPHNATVAAETVQSGSDRQQQQHSNAPTAQAVTQHVTPHAAEEAQPGAAQARSMPAVSCTSSSQAEARTEISKAMAQHKQPSPHEHAQQLLPDPAVQQPHQQQELHQHQQQDQHQHQQLPQKRYLPHHLQPPSATPTAPPSASRLSLSTPPAPQLATPSPSHSQAELCTPAQAGSCANASPRTVSFAPVRRILGKVGTHHKKSRLNASSKPGSQVEASPDSARHTQTDTSQESPATAPAAAAPAQGQSRSQLSSPLSQPSMPSTTSAPSAPQIHHHRHPPQQQQQQQQAQDSPLDMLRNSARQGARPDLTHKPVQQHLGQRPPLTAQAPPHSSAQGPGQPIAQPASQHTAQNAAHGAAQRPASKGSNPFARRTTPRAFHGDAQQLDEHADKEGPEDSPWMQPAATLHTPGLPSAVPSQHHQPDTRQRLLSGANAFHAAHTEVADNLPADFTPMLSSADQHTRSTEDKRDGTEQMPCSTEWQPGDTQQQTGRKRGGSSRRRDRPKREIKRLYSDSQGSQDEQAEEMRVYGIRMPDRAQEQEDQDLLMDLSFLKTPAPFSSAKPAATSSALPTAAPARPSISPEAHVPEAAAAAAPSGRLRHVPRKTHTPSAEPDAADEHRHTASPETSPQRPAARHARSMQPSAPAHLRASSFPPAARPAAAASAGGPQLQGRPQAADPGPQQQPAAAAVKPQLKRLERAGTIEQERQQDFDQQQKKASLLPSQRQPPAGFTTAANLEPRHIADSSSSSEDETAQHSDDAFSKDGSASEEDDGDEDHDDTLGHDIIDLAGESSGDDSPSEHDDSASQPEIIEEGDDEVQLISSMPAQQRAGNPGGARGVASHPPRGGEGPTGGSSGEPWWMRFPDFVPVEALKWGKNPRDDTPVYINYREQFSSSSRVTLEPGSGRRASKGGSARKTGEAGAKKGKKRTWFNRKAYHRR